MEWGVPGEWKVVRWLPKLLPTVSSSLSPNTSNPWSPQPTLLASSWSLPSLAHPLTHPYHLLPLVSSISYPCISLKHSQTILFAHTLINKHVFESLLSMKKSNYQMSLAHSCFSNSFKCTICLSNSFSSCIFKHALGALPFLWVGRNSLPSLVYPSFHH